MSISPRRIVRAAGIPSSFCNRSAYQGELNKYFLSFSSPRKKCAPLSPRLRQQVESEQRIYKIWLEKWDKSTGINRYIMLQQITMECQGFTRPELEKRFGNSSELVFFHIISFFKVNCKKICSIGLQMNALRVFLEASSGSDFVEAFIRSGLHLIIAELLESKHLDLCDKIQIIQTFSSCAISLKFNQNLVDNKIPVTVISTLGEIKNDQYHNQVMTLLTKLGYQISHLSENIMSSILPYFLAYSNDVRALRTLARVYRILLLPELAGSFDIKGHLDEMMVLSKVNNMEVQSDGILIFSYYAAYVTPMRCSFLLRSISNVLCYFKDDFSEEFAKSIESQQVFVMRFFIDVYSSKSSAALCLGKMITYLLTNFVRLLGCHSNFSIQHYAAQCICKAMEYDPQVKVNLLNAIPTDWVEALINNPREFCLGLTQTQIDTFSCIEQSQFLFDPSFHLSSREEFNSPISGRTTPPVHKNPIVERKSPLKFSPRFHYHNPDL